jgi:3-(methylthio)propionyl---CoA ligase
VLKVLGLMQPHALMISSILTHAARHHAHGEIVSRTFEGGLHRYTWADVEQRARRLVRALQRLGIRQHDRVGTLAWNDYRHLEIYYAAPGMQAICHTINPRLHIDDIAYIINHAADKVLFADPGFVPMIQELASRIAGSVETIVLMTTPECMPAIALPAGIRLACYDDLINAVDDDYVWPSFDENTASALCYTSGTTGRPKGALYSHRSTWLHGYAVSMPDAFDFRATSRILPVVPMFHVNAWGIPYASAINGCALVLPGRHLDGPSLASLLNEERVTFTAGVPTVWLSLLQHLRSSGGKLDTVERIMTGGSAAPPLMIEAYRDEFNVRVEHGWGMTEVSPVGTYNAPKPPQVTLSKPETVRHMLKQGRILAGIDMKIVDGDGNELPWDGVAFGNLMVRGPWIASSYFGEAAGSALDQDGWFGTGDVATIDPDGFMEITDRAKDVIKSGGEWISSITLENIAVSHPDVAEAAVIAVPHPKWDERPLLLVVPRSDHVIDVQSILKIFEGKVAKWWLPDDVIAVPELPHTATGKLLKTSLRSRFRDHYKGGS